MKKWDAFVLNINPEVEKQLLKKCSVIKKTLATAISTLYKNIGHHYEPLNEKVSFGALARCGTCLESMLLLVRSGYIGSANALLRQVYEFLVWTKFTVDARDDSILIELHDSFYELSLERRADVLMKLFKRASYQSDTFSNEEIIKIGKDTFGKYAFVTHASMYAQQCPVKTEDFYLNLDACLTEIAIWVLCYIELIQRHFDRCLEGYEVSTNNTEELTYLGAIYYALNLLWRQKGKFMQTFPLIKNSLLYKSFSETKWGLKGDRA